MPTILGEAFTLYLNTLLGLTCGPTKPSPITKKKRRHGKTIKSNAEVKEAPWNKKVMYGSLHVNRLKTDRTNESTTLTISAKIVSEYLGVVKRLCKTSPILPAIFATTGFFSLFIPIAACMASSSAGSSLSVTKIWSSNCRNVNRCNKFCYMQKRRDRKIVGWINPETVQCVGTCWEDSISYRLASHMYLNLNSINSYVDTRK